ncbi:MAG: transcription-repair coupling factor [Candidatus Dormibacteraceae bacterium]
MHRLPRATWPILAGAVARLCQAQGRSLLVLVPGPQRFLEELRPWLAEVPPSYLYAEVTVSFLDRPPAFDEAVGPRLEALAALAGEDGALVVSSRRAAMRVTVAPDELALATVQLRPGWRGEPLAVAARLVEMGYSREALVEAPGQFSLRGGILDVFPAAGRSPVRAEWFGDELDTLRVFDPANQRSVMQAPQATIRPGREVLLGAERGAAAVRRLRSEGGLEGLRADVRSEWEDDLERLGAGSSFPGVELFAAYLAPGRPSLFDHLAAEALVLDLDPHRQLADAREVEQETEMLAAAESRDGELPGGFRPPMVEMERLERPGRRRLEVVTSEAPEAAAGGAGHDGGGSAGGFIDLGWAEVEPVVGRPQALAELARRVREARGGLTLVLASEQGPRIEALLDESGVRRRPEPIDLDLDLESRPGMFSADLDVAAGCRHAAMGFWLLSDRELFGRVRKPAPRVSRISKAGVRDSTLTLEFQPDELVVHVDHGIARFKGMRLMEADGADREYLELEYAEGDRLFVPVESLDRVQKYLGGGEGHPSLHRLGTGDWARARGRARRSVEDVAGELLRLYSAREARPGFAFPPDAPWQGELEASFPYEETPDQVVALAEIKADMELDRPMDRLVCGDVGFGKTELAVRAAFKAVLSGKQVAMLVPTTVLAQQHFQVISDRLKPYPVTVEMLSRFRSDEEQAATVAGIRTGQVDVVIGTHRLLQRDVRFSKLGLVVIDEEQRFGVMQKERLKKMRSQVDVLTLSATPIPRTMHMAVAGLRDMSVIQTPPEDRQPIKTYVTAEEDELLAEVINREIDRGGQVFFVHNRVRTIERAADGLARLVPHARLAVGHGRMAEEELAKVMVDFAAGEHDVLVCTTIIESGLDMPNVNTLIVQNANTFGLAQLYQLRGRVGRSGKRAYAYFLYDPRRSLTEAADKRLDVISGLHELGLGFKIALRDLEIRGAGNLLGTEQHGAIVAVGFEMYTQMLQSAVARMREAGPSVRGRGGDAAEASSNGPPEGGEPDLEDIVSGPELALDLPLDHFIPRSFVREERLRLGAYRELAAASDEDSLAAVVRSLRDRYGNPPAQLENLVFSLRVKHRGEHLRLRSVAVKDDLVEIRVDPDRVLEVEDLERLYGSRLSVGPNRLRLRCQPDRWREELVHLLEALARLYARERIESGA